MSRGLDDLAIAASGENVYILWDWNNVTLGAKFCMHIAYIME
jgi:hypothetical protein